jgi:hypothetical protein
VTLAAIATVLAIVCLIAAAIISWAGLSIAVLISVRLATKDRRCAPGTEPAEPVTLQLETALRQLLHGLRHRYF